jgi:hypothetical protein
MVLLEWVVERREDYEMYVSLILDGLCGVDDALSLPRESNVYV